MSAAMPVQALDRVFANAAQAVLAAQSRLDERLVEAPVFAHSIPKVRVEAKFGVTTLGGKTAVFFGSKSEQQQMHTVGFDLLLTPEPQAAIARSSSAPPTAISLPPFIESPANIAKVLDELVAQLVGA